MFLKLGTTAFGGPAAHIAMMEDEVVRRRPWLTSGQFLDYLGATNLIPGPNSTELAIHIGRARAGWRGLLVAGISFILPATLIVSAAAWGYVQYGALPAATGVLYGIKPVVIAIVIQALWSLGRRAAQDGGACRAWTGVDRRGGVRRPRTGGAGRRGGGHDREPARRGRRTGRGAVVDPEQRAGRRPRRPRPRRRPRRPSGCGRSSPCF